MYIRVGESHKTDWTLEAEFLQVGQSKRWGETIVNKNVDTRVEQTYHVIHATWIVVRKLLMLTLLDFLTEAVMTYTFQLLIYLQILLCFYK